MKLAAPLLVALAVVSAAAPSVGSSSGSAAKAMSTGVFDTGCVYSHTLPDDPLLHPNMPGMSHLHDFFGNRTTMARSTGNGLLTATRASANNTTCRDKRDGSGYWTPALFQNGAKLRPERVHVYYRNNGRVAAKPFPVGFGMITHKYSWRCGPGKSLPLGAKHRDGVVPACPSGRLFVILTFPACWDGVHLFSMNGSHVSYAPRCDATHPVRLPELSMILSYRVDGKPHTYALASGNPTTAHADFFNAWEPQRLAQLVETCLNHGRAANCKQDEDR